MTSSAIVLIELDTVIPQWYSIFSVSPFIAARCNGVSPRSLRLLTPLPRFGVLGALGLFARACSILSENFVDFLENLSLTINF